MKKILILTALAVTISAMSGCSTTGEPDNTITNEAVVTEQPQAEPTLAVYSDYALLPGHTVYISPDSAFSIQLPEGNTVNDADPANVTISLLGTFANPDIINISKSTTAAAVYTEAQLYELLASDNSIDVTGFYVLENAEDGAYKGYKYSYVSYADPQLKGITSTYFSSDGTAYVIDATINNGGDEINVNNINLIIDTFINYL